MPQHIHKFWTTGGTVRKEILSTWQGACIRSGCRRSKYGAREDSSFDETSYMVQKTVHDVNCDVETCT